MGVRENEGQQRVGVREIGERQTTRTGLSCILVWSLPVAYCCYFCCCFHFLFATFPSHRRRHSLLVCYAYSHPTLPIHRPSSYYSLCPSPLLSPPCPSPGTHSHSGRGNTCRGDDVTRVVPLRGGGREGGVGGRVLRGVGG